MRLTITSGGQAGADQGALRAARSRGIPTGGWCPKGWLTEDGPAPWLADYGLRECPEHGYPARTRANVRDADALLWFGNPYSPGGRVTFGAMERTSHVAPAFVVIHTSTPADVADWLTGTVFPGEGAVRLMVAGNRESGSPGIGGRVEAFVGEVLDLLAGTVDFDSPTPGRA